ncbi:MAG: caspase family protein [Hyphomicrobiaceae bacterium]
MLARILAAGLFWLAVGSTAEARRVALVIGQDAYAGMDALDNSARDACKVADLLAKHGFEVIACDGATPGCFNADSTRLKAGLAKLEQRAAGADMALVYFAGHGLASDEGNILTPTDAKMNCSTGAITNGIPVERFMAATNPAKMKLLILDACRDNPVGAVCPGLKGKKLSFTRIEAGAMQGLLVVTSTQFGQQALDGAKGGHSPFATSLLTALAANPTIYFEQVFNEVARATHEAALAQDGFLQIPGKVVGGAAPADCLAGKNCIGDQRMAALAVENEKLTADASGVRNLLAAEEQKRGKPYTPEERAKRVADLSRSLQVVAASGDPIMEEAGRRFSSGDVAGGTAKLDEAGEADEQAMAELERMLAEKRKATARNARAAAVLVRGTSVLKAMGHYQRATKADPGDAQTWDDYARAAVEAGKLEVAKAAFQQAALKARDSSNPRLRYWATLGLGDVALDQGHLPSARRLYESALAIVEPIAKADPGNAGWQRDLSVSHNKIGDVLRAQGNLPAALDAFNASLAIAERLAKADPGNAGWQRDLSVSQEKIGDVLVEQGNLPAALDAFNAALAIAERLAKADPGNAGWQRDLSVSHNKIGDVLVEQGNLPAALDAFNASLAIRERLAKADPGNAGWQRDLALSFGRVAQAQAQQGDRDGALKGYRQARDIIARLKAQSPDNATLPKDLAFYEARMAELEK